MTGENLYGMKVSDAREYILGFISTKKLSEKKIAALDLEAEKWKKREQLALERGEKTLALEAEREFQKVEDSRAVIRLEISELDGNIKSMIAQLPGLAARERNVDPDILEQELLMAAGYMPGDEEKATVDRRFAAMEKEAAAESALEELKRKMNETGEETNREPHGQ